eukprot:473547-Pyramimonas_sp.AAC.1
MTEEFQKRCGVRATIEEHEFSKSVVGTSRWPLKLGTSTFPDLLCLATNKRVDLLAQPFKQPGWPHSFQISLSSVSPGESMVFGSIIGRCQ